MKKLNLVLSSVFLINCAAAQTTIASEGFENTSTLFSVGGATYAYFSGTLPGPGLPAGANYAVQGSFGLGSTNGTVTVASNAINTLAYASIELRLRVAAFSLTATAGLDQTDRVRVAISGNGGGSFSDIVTVTGATTNNSYWAYGGTGIASTAYPTAIVSNATSTGANPDGYSTILITNLPSVVDMRVNIILSNSFNERWVIDNFTLTGISTLPVVLLSFNGGLQNNNGLLEWEIATPEDGGKYEVQRSSDGSNFITINTQRGDAAKTRFNYTDASLASDRNYYRLKMTDNTGKLTYSHIIRLSRAGDAGSLIYPNPVKDKTVLQINDPSLKGTTARLVNSKGSIVQSYIIRNNFEIIDMSSLSPGFYLLRLANGNTFKLLKE